MFALEVRGPDGFATGGIERMELAVAEPGDLVVVFQSGAYGASASPSSFLGHGPALERLV